MFELVSGLTVNWSKTHMPGIFIPKSDCIHLANLLGYAYKGWPLEYLGLPLGGSWRLKEFWQPVLECCKRRLAIWKATTYPLVVE